MIHKKNPWDSILSTRNILISSIFIELILFYFYYFPDTKLLLGDENRYLSTAHAIAQGGQWHTDPLWPPMQSLLIALFIKLFNQPILPLQIFQYGVLLLSGFIVKNIVWRETGHSTSSQIALAIMLLFPSWLAYSHYLWPEVIHVFLFVAILWIINYKNKYLSWMLLSGVLLGLAILFKSLLILFVPFFYINLFRNNAFKNSLLKMALSLLMTIVVISPASFKAHQMTGGWMVSNSSMFNLWMGLNDDTRQHFSHPIGGETQAEFNQSGDNFKQKHQKFKEKSLQKISDDGLFLTVINQINKQYFRLFDHQTFFSQQFNGERKNNYVNKYSLPHNHWLVLLMLTLNNVIYFMVLIGALFGLVLTVKKSQLSQQLLLFLLYVLGLFLLLHSKPRFRIPLIPLMAIYSSFLIAYLQAKTNRINAIFTDKFNVIIMVSVSLFVAILIFGANVLDKYWPI